MTAVPGVFGRVPNVLASQIALRNLTQTNIDLLNLNTQLSTQRRINRPSDDAVASSVISVLDNKLELTGQRERNLNHAESVMNTIDSTLEEISANVLEATSLASSQVGVGSDTGTRRAQASVVDQYLTQLFGAVNRDFAGVRLFSGAQAGSPPFEVFNGGYRFVGDLRGLETDLGPEIDFPINVGADVAVGAVSARVEGDVDLNPTLTAGTFVRDLRGPFEGRSLGLMSVTIDDGATPVDVQVDLSEAETVGDVMNIIESAIRDADAAALGGAFPAGVTIAGSGDRLSINGVAAGYSISFSDGPVGETASALGLDAVTYDAGTTVAAGPEYDLDPRVTDRTALGSLDPVAAVVFGDITIRNGNQSGTVTTTAGMTVGEFREAVRRLDLGVRVTVDDSGDSINVLNEVSGLRMSVSDTGTATATTLGIRTFTGSTLVNDLNDGRGVEIADGATDENGLPDPNRNVDFRVTLSDGSTSFDVDLTPGDMDTVQSVVDAINAAWTAAGPPPGGFAASVNPAGNGILLTDAAGGAQAMQVTSLNGYAAEDLGLLAGEGSVTTGVGAELAGEDRATVRVDSLFSTLIELRESLLNDDVRGITFAGGRLDADAERLTESRALVGSRTATVERVRERQQQNELLDREIKSQLQDLDFFEASSRYSLLQTQLQAALTVTAQSQQLSLINFLG